MAATDRIWFAKSPNSDVNSSTVPRDTRVIYTTGLTILALLITSYTKGHVETLWLRNTLVSLEQYDVPTSVRSKAIGFICDIYPLLSVGLAVKHVLGPSGDICLVVDGNTSSSGLTWQLSNGSTIALNVSAGVFCAPPVTSAESPEFGYLVGGVAIDFSALGTPVDGDDLSPFGDLIYQANNDGLQ